MPQIVSPRIASWLALPLLVTLPTAAPALARDESKPSSGAIALEPSDDVRRVFEKTVPQSVDDLLAIETHVSQLAEKLQPCVVGVRIGNAQGSGVIISKDGYVLTAAHVSGDAGRKAHFTLSDGRQLEGRTLGHNRTVDAGLMKIDADEDLPFVEMADYGDVRVGDWTVAMGHPGGYKNGRTPVVRIGRVVVKRDSVVQTDNALVGGDSGGPLFDVAGRVIGIHSRIGPSITWNFHVPISAYTDDWDRLAKSETWGGRPGASRAILGVNGEDAPDGALVTGLPDGYPAKEAGLRVGDVILAVDDERTETFGDLAGYIAGKEPGDEVTLKVLRGDETIEIEVELADRES